MMRQFYFVLWFMTGWQTVVAQPLTPAQIFARTTAAYQSAATYQDSGEVRDYIRRKDPRWYEKGDYTSQKPFKTAFVRKTGQFRYKYRDTKRDAATACVVWSDGKQFKTWWSITRQVAQAQTLARALGGTTGISGGSSTRVSSLLLSGIGSPNWSLTNLRKVVALPPMVVTGKTCYHLLGTVDRQPYGARAKSPVPIKGPTVSHPAIDVWIDTATFLIIRVSETYSRGTESFELTTTFYPVLNQPVKSTALAFDYEHF